MKAGRKAPEGGIRMAAGKPVAIKAAEGEGQGPRLKRFEGVAYTGAPMVPEGWKVPVIVDLGGVIVPSQQRPALRQHDPNNLVGHTESVVVDERGIHVAGVLSGEDRHVDSVAVPAANGFRWQMSIGANPVRRELLKEGDEAEVNGRTVVGPMVISRETELGEISFVPLGADGETSATVMASKGRFHMFAKEALKLARAQGVKAALNYSDEDIEKMTEEEAKAALKKCMKGSPEAESEDDEDLEGEEEVREETDLEDEEDRPAKSGKKAKIRASGRKPIKAGKRSPAAQFREEMRKEYAAEARRVARINATVQQYGVRTVAVDGKDVDLAAHAIENGWTADRTELHALRASRASASVGNGPHVYSTSNPELSEAVLEAAVLHAGRHQFKLNDDDFYAEPTPDGKGTMRRIPAHLQAETQRELRGRYTDKVQQHAHTLFKGRIGLQQIFHEAFRASGVREPLDFRSEQGVRSILATWHHLEPGSLIRAEGASNLSIGNVLSNVQNKYALQGYLFTEQAWREFCAVRSVNDFKDSKSINLLGDVMYKQVGPIGELEQASFQDQAFANRAKLYGLIGTIPYTHIVNDDLGILSTVPLKIGQGAGLALNDNIWALWKSMAAGTVNGDDGNAFWRTTSSAAFPQYKPNKMSGAGSALSATALQTAKAMFDNQVDPNGNPLGFDGTTPVLLHGPSNYMNATALMQASAIVYGGATAALQPNVNVWQGQMKPVMSRYVENARYVNSATAFWVLFNPVALAAIEVAFLNGIDTPAVLTAGPDYQFDKLGISIRGTMAFNANQQNFRGGVYSVGS